MKKHILCTAIASAMVIFGGALLLSGCQKEKDEFLDLDLANITMMTTAQKATFDEATKRLDQYVSFNEITQQYLFSQDVTASKVWLSERLFDYLKSNVGTTNLSLQQTKGAGLIAMEVSRNCLKIIDPQQGFNFTPTRALNQYEMGGLNDVDCHWWGMDVYVSHSLLESIKDGSYNTATMAGFVAAIEPSKISGIITASAGLLGYTADKLADAYPNGIVITLGAYLVPVYVEGQHPGQ